MARINGTPGSDFLSGTPESDIIIARSGNDQILGNSGNDVLYGNRGRDTLTGGTGSDKFVLSGGPDLITDFTNGQDLIGLPGNVSFNQLQILPSTGANAGDTIISIGRFQLAILDGVSSNLINQADFTNDLTPISEPTQNPGRLAFSQPTYNVNENGVNATIQVTRTGGSDGAVSVNYFTSNGTATAGSDYTTASGVLNFADGETSRTFTIPISNDNTVEGNETVNLALNNPTGGASLGTVRNATLTIIDNDSASSSDFDIEFDYRFDSTGFFNDPTRRAALEAAGEVWESVIQDEFASVPAGTQLRVQNPATGSISERITLEEAIDDVLVFVGARNLPGNIIGLAGFSAIFIGDGLSNRLSGSDFEPWTGQITFDTDTDWFFDSTPNTTNDVPFGDVDFISTAVHEIGHILGISTAPIFEELSTFNGFEGPNALSINGGDPVPLESDLHVQEGFLGNTVVMDPIQNPGASNRTLSEVDLALLADIGYEIAGFTL